MAGETCISLVKEPNNEAQKTPNFDPFISGSSLFQVAARQQNSSMSTWQVLFMSVLHVNMDTH